MALPPGPPFIPPDPPSPPRAPVAVTDSPGAPGEPGVQSQRPPLPLIPFEPSLPRTITHALPPAPPLPVLLLAPGVPLGALHSNVIALAPGNNVARITNPATALRHRFLRRILLMPASHPLESSRFVNYEFTAGRENERRPKRLP